VKSDKCRRVSSIGRNCTPTVREGLIYWITCVKELIAI
jgi:hypothetical protein